MLSNISDICLNNYHLRVFRCGPASIASIAIGYGLDGPGIESRWGGGARFSAPVQTGPGAHPASCTMGTGSFQGVKSGRGVTLTPHPLRVPSSRKGRDIPLLPLRSVRPVQSLSACTGVTFTFLPVFPILLLRRREHGTHDHEAWLDFQKEYIAFVFNGAVTLHYPSTLEDGGTVVVQNVRDSLPVQTAEHNRTQASLIYL